MSALLGGLDTVAVETFGITAALGFILLEPGTLSLCWIKQGRL